MEIQKRMLAGGSGGGALALGVKGRLSNQEMELLRHKLAQATAYDHYVPNQQHTKARLTSKPMTKRYHKVNDDGDPAACAEQQHRTGRKTLSSIQYEQQFVAPTTYDSHRVVPKKGISSGAKTILQDEYVTKPRHVSSIPVNLMPTDSKLDNNGDAVGGAAGDGRHRGGKRMGPAPIPQVFIL